MYWYDINYMKVYINKVILIQSFILVKPNMPYEVKWSRLRRKAISTYLKFINLSPIDELCIRHSMSKLINNVTCVTSRTLPSKKVEEDTTCSMDQRSGLLDKKNTWCNIFIWELPIYKPLIAWVRALFLPERVSLFRKVHGASEAYLERMTRISTLRRM
jgi:hypothetical protein